MPRGQVKASADVFVGLRDPFRAFGAFCGRCLNISGLNISTVNVLMCAYGFEGESGPFS